MKSVQDQIDMFFSVTFSLRNDYTYWKGRTELSFLTVAKILPILTFRTMTAVQISTATLKFFEIVFTGKLKL